MFTHALCLALLNLTSEGTNIPEIRHGQVAVVEAGIFQTCTLKGTAGLLLIIIEGTPKKSGFR
jgi:hypothetical protein